MFTCSGHLFAHSCMGCCSYCVHIIFINLSAVYCATLATSITVFFPLPSHTFSLSFCHSSKYPVGPGCGLLVLVYLVLGSIQLQAGASHSSQSHKMWLVLTTALRGDGLIGLIVSDRLVWTRYRKTTATACCGFLPFPALSFSPYYFLTLIFVNLSPSYVYFHDFIDCFHLNL